MELAERYQLNQWVLFHQRRIGGFAFEIPPALSRHFRVSTPYMDALRWAYDSAHLSTSRGQTSLPFNDLSASEADLRSVKLSRHSEACYACNDQPVYGDKRLARGKSRKSFLRGVVKPGS